MAYPTQLNNLYKSEKQAGLTDAKSFPEWHKLYKDGLTYGHLSQHTTSVLLSVPAADVDTSELTSYEDGLETFKPTDSFVDDELGLDLHVEPLTKDQLNALEEHLNQMFEPPALTSEQIEYSIIHMPLSPEQILAITTTLAEPEVVIPTSKAAHARLIYDQMEQQALATKIKLVRKDIIKRFMAELPISDKGASTYYQNIKAKKGLINHK